jgi:hypothetical protein
VHACGNKVANPEAFGSTHEQALAYREEDWVDQVAWPPPAGPAAFCSDLKPPLALHGDSSTQAALHGQM